MSQVFVDVVVSLASCMAEANRGPHNRLDGGTAIHHWIFQTASFLQRLGLPGWETLPDDQLVREMFERMPTMSP